MHSRGRAMDDCDMSIVGDRDVVRFAANYHSRLIGSRSASSGAGSGYTLPFGASPVFRRACATRGGTLQPQRPVRAGAAGNFNLAATDDVIAAGAIALIVERLPLSVGIQFAERVEFVFSRESQGRYGRHV